MNLVDVSTFLFYNNSKNKGYQHKRDKYDAKYRLWNNKAGLRIERISGGRPPKYAAKKPKNGAIEWGLIAGTCYIFVWWLNNAGMWIYAITFRGTEYLQFIHKT